jgi:hypothetical protein
MHHEAQGTRKEIAQRQPHEDPKKAGEDSNRHAQKAYPTLEDQPYHPGTLRDWNPDDLVLIVIGIRRCGHPHSRFLRVF